MQRILRPLHLIALVALAAVLLAACGGDDADSGTDVNTLLEETFSGEKKVEKGRVQLALELNAQGAGTEQLQGPVKVNLGGPFESQGKGKVPKFDVDFSFEGAGQSIKAGVASTGDKAFVNFNGQEYAVSDEVFQQFRTGYEQAQQKATEGGNENPSFQTLGIDPRKWLTDPKNAGEAKVGDTDTIRITGGVDVGKLLDDVNNALQKAGELGLQGQAQLPTKLTDEQKKQVTDAVEDLKVEIFTGKDDKILRRMIVDLAVVAPEGTQGGGSADMKLDLQLLDLGESQDIEAPADAKPFEELVNSLGGGGGLGGLLGGGAGGGSGGGSGSGGGASSEDLEKYTQCVEDAGQDLEKAQQCAELLTP